MQDVAVYGLDLHVRHRSVAGPEVNGVIGELPDAAPRPDGLVVDLDVGVLGMVLQHPLGVDGIGKGRSRPGEPDRPLRCRAPRQKNRSGGDRQQCRECLGHGLLSGQKVNCVWNCARLIDLGAAPLAGVW